jgi:hypothetical protein
MPDSNAVAPLADHAAAERLNALLDDAKTFIAPDRRRVVLAKWVPRHGPDELSQYRAIAMMADAILLAADLLPSQPSAGGSTAFDRLARARRGAPAREVAEIAALGRARFRLIGLDPENQDSDPSVVPAHDLLTGQRLRIAGLRLPPLLLDAPLFARVVMLADGLCCLVGAITPLDEAAHAAAYDHPSAGAVSVAGNARWAEAVYHHVVCHGTLDVPGLNRPREDFGDAETAWLEDDEEDDEVLALALDWQALGDATPDEGLIARTRLFANMQDICEALLGALHERTSGQEPLAVAAERMLLVQLETVRRDVGSETLESVRDALDQEGRIGRAAARSRPAVRRAMSAPADCRSGR